MLQEILTYIILFLSIFVVFYRIYHTFVKPKKDGCSGCYSNCNGCSLSNFKNEIRLRKK
jgi:hypothetical protein